MIMKWFIFLTVTAISENKQDIGFKYKRGFKAAFCSSCARGNFCICPPTQIYTCTMSWELGAGSLLQQQHLGSFSAQPCESTFPAEPRRSKKITEATSKLICLGHQKLSRESGLLLYTWTAKLQSDWDAALAALWHSCLSKAISRWVMPENSVSGLEFVI